MKRFLIAVSAAALLLGSCTGQKSQTAEGAAAPDAVADSADLMPMDSLERILVETPTPKAMDQLFDDFLFNFAANKKLQTDRIVFPLTVVKAGETSHVEKRDWKMERFFMKQGYYTLMFNDDAQMELMKDTAVSQAIVQKITLTPGTVKSYVFSRIKGAWMLREMREGRVEDDVNASFIAFFRQFATSMDYQRRCLSETVKFVGPDPDDDNSVMEGILTADTWEAFAPQLPDKMIYNIIYGAPQAETSHKIFILRGISNGLELELRFKRRKGHWQLYKMTT